MAKWFSNTALIAVAYLLAGQLGQLLTVPPTYATAVWPASGIALAAILLLGYRVWPGVFVGAVLANGWMPLMRAADTDAAATALGVAISIACGATLQAVVARLLIQRFVGFPNALIRERDILGFLALGGPVACLIGASWGVGTLYFAGQLDVSLIPMNWWTWWVGDVGGVIIFTPLVLICFAQPASAWRPRRHSVALPLCLTFALTTIGFFYAKRFELSQVQLIFERQVGEVFGELQERLTSHLGAVRSVKSLYASSDHVERTEFATFNQHLLSQHTGVQALEWCPRVLGAERAEYEARGREDGVEGLLFTERAEDGSLVPAARREEYYPVWFVEPETSNISALGFDMGSDPQRREALQQAGDTGAQVATGPLSLLEEGDDPTGFLVFDPVYHKDRPLETEADRRAALEGYVVGVFRFRDTVAATLPADSPAEFRLHIVDPAAGPQRRVIYETAEEGGSAPTPETASILRTTHDWSDRLTVAGREWEVNFEPTAAFFAGQSNTHAWLILTGGLAFTGLLGTFLLILAARAAQVEELVADRTRELSTANQELAQEITHRKRFESALSQAHEELERRVEERTAELTVSEARYLDLYDNAPDMFVSVDVATQRVTECNKTFLTVTGYAKAEVVGRLVYDLYHPDCLEQARQSFRLFMTMGRTDDLELLLLRADGEVVHVSMNVSAVRNADGKLLYSRAVLRDITAKKQAEARIRDQEIKLAHVSRLSMMGEMATGLAHEINQPLAAIAAYAEGAALRMRRGKLDPQRLAQIVDRISADAHRAGEVIRRLRKFVRKREPDRTEIDLNELIVDVIQFVAADVRHRRVKIDFDAAENLPRVQADPVEIQQVLLNLIRNGCDAMQQTAPRDRRLLVRTRGGEEEAVDVEVADRGQGLSESMEDQVFEAFFSSKDDGLGMGLAISRSIIESHGGRIWVTPNLDGGVTFHFSLPVAEGALIDE